MLPFLHAREDDVVYLHGSRRTTSSARWSPPSGSVRRSRRSTACASRARGSTARSSTAAWWPSARCGSWTATTSARTRSTPSSRPCCRGAASRSDDPTPPSSPSRPSSRSRSTRRAPRSPRGRPRTSPRTWRLRCGPGTCPRPSSTARRSERPTARWRPARCRCPERPRAARAVTPTRGRGARARPQGVVRSMTSSRRTSPRRSSSSRRRRALRRARTGRPRTASAFAVSTGGVVLLATGASACGCSPAGTSTSARRPPAPPCASSQRRRAPAPSTSSRRACPRRRCMTGPGGTVTSTAGGSSGSPRRRSRRSPARARRCAGCSPTRRSHGASPASSSASPRRSTRSARPPRRGGRVAAVNDALLALAELDVASCAAPRGRAPARALAQDAVLVELRELRTRKRELDAARAPLATRGGGPGGRAAAARARAAVDGGAARRGDRRGTRRSRRWPTSVTRWRVAPRSSTTSSWWCSRRSSRSTRPMPRCAATQCAPRVGATSSRSPSPRSASRRPRP